MSAFEVSVAISSIVLVEHFLRGEFFVWFRLASLWFSKNILSFSNDVAFD